LDFDGINQVIGPTLALVLPIGLALWFRRKALLAPAEARASVWFSSFRFLRYINLGTIALWWIATDFVGLKARAWFFWLENLPDRVPAGRAIFLFCFWIPPMAALVCCQVLFHPVYVRIREVHWTRGELARQAAFALGVSLVPALFVIGGIVELTSGGSFKDFALSYALAAFFGIVSARALRKHLQLTPSALTTGELRDRAFSLAGRLGVKLQQIYLLPAGKSRLANAFARSGNSILLSEVLLTDLNKREVDSVVAHELSHLRRNHPHLLGFALLSGLAVVMTPYFFFPPLRTWQPLFDLAFIAVPLLSFYFVSRRFEYAADIGSIKLTGDPAAMITALVKLHQLNLMPLEWSKWSEKGMTHPSTVRRARAIGRFAEMSEQRVKELLATPLLRAPGLPEAHYEVSHTSSPAKAFSSEFKRRVAVRALLFFAGLVVLLPSLLLRTLDEFAWPGSTWQTFLLVLILCLAATATFANYTAFLGYAGLCRRLRSKLSAEGVPLKPGGGWLVGFAPGSAPRVFESNYSWDIGFLSLTADRLCYWGEETRFALCREQIISIEAGRGIPDWLRTQFLYIRWRAAAGQPEMTFNVRPAEVRSLLAMRRAFRDLQRQIASWHIGATSLGFEPDSAASLPLPPTGQVTSTSVRTLRDPRQILSLLMFAGFASGFVAALLSLPIESVTATYLAEKTDVYAGISGWYAVLISLLMVLFRFGPAWFLRQPDSLEPAAVRPPPVPATKPDTSNVR
jgi:Zn-dependent protease with chaperone function